MEEEGKKWGLIVPPYYLFARRPCLKAGCCYTSMYTVYTFGSLYIVIYNIGK